MIQKSRVITEGNADDNNHKNSENNFENNNFKNHNNEIKIKEQNKILSLEDKLKLGLEAKNESIKNF